MEAMEAESPAPLSADDYYMKALNYLASSTAANLDGTYHSDEGSCVCLHCLSSEEAEDEDFTMSFRPGLTHDLHGSSSSNHGATSGRGRDPAARRHSTSSHPSLESRVRKGSIGSKSCVAAGGGEGGQPRVRRKLSDGHVHWADEFHKDLARCHPRKAYNRHPPQQTPLVKPILKPNSGDCEPSFEESSVN